MAILHDQLTVGLAHEDRFVRESCLEFWEKQPAAGAAQAGRVIDALQIHGLRAFSYPHEAYTIPLDRAGFERLTETLHGAPCFDDKDREYLGRWLQWCLSVESGMLPELEAFLKSERALSFDGNGFVSTGRLLERATRMRRHEAFDASACYAGIEKAFEDINLAETFPHRAVAEVQSLLDQLIKVEAPMRVAELATSWLALDPTPDLETEGPDDGDATDDFRFGFGVYLAGELGLTSGIDRIIDGVSRTDWDWLNESSTEALIKMPAGESTARLRARWWSLPEYGRLFFSDVFEFAHLPEHREFYLENMRRGHDFESIPHRMARALALLGDPDSLEEVANYWQANAYDPEADEVAEILYAIHRLRNETPPVLEPIRERLLETEARQTAADARLAGLAKVSHFPEQMSQAAPIPLPVVRKSPKIGRNDPCPCGSGKKYKKCCL